MFALPAVIRVRHFTLAKDGHGLDCSSSDLSIYVFNHRATTEFDDSTTALTWHDAHLALPEDEGKFMRIGCRSP